jgi:hypothetical protein
MAEAGIISEMPTLGAKYAFAVTMPAKKAADGTWSDTRICVDQRRNNEEPGAQVCHATARRPVTPRARRQVHQQAGLSLRLVKPVVESGVTAVHSILLER